VSKLKLNFQMGVPSLVEFMNPILLHYRKDAALRQREVNGNNFAGYHTSYGVVNIHYSVNGDGAIFQQNRSICYCFLFSRLL
jgi:hypothetical protein